MSVRQIVNFCNEKIDVMMEEAVVAMKSESAVQAHHATAQALQSLHSCRAILKDSTVKIPQYGFNNFFGNEAIN